MFQHNRITREKLDLYLKGLFPEPNTEYELSMDIYGGPINIFVSGYGIVRGSGSNYIDYNADWRRYTFPFTTGDNSDGALSTFVDWGIAFVKKAGELLPTDVDDTYIDNVRLVSTARPEHSLIDGGDFETAKSSAVYAPHWRGEILGMSGAVYGVDIVTDPLNKHNRCLKLPRVSQSDNAPHSMPLDVSCFGFFKGNEQDITIVNYHSNRDHHFFFVNRGQAVIEAEGDSFTASQDTLIYIPPQTSYHCTLLEGRNAIYYRLEFSGSCAPSLLKALGLETTQTLVLPDIAALTSYIDGMQQFAPQSATYTYAAAGLLQLLLAELERQKTASYPREKHRAAIEKIAQKLRDTPEAPVRSAELAEECGLSGCYFITLFKQYTGYSPQQYRLRELVSKACTLLRDTTMTVQEISYTLGIDDPLYFSRLFRSIQGISPRDYRKHRTY